VAHVRRQHFDVSGLLLSLVADFVFHFRHLQHQLKGRLHQVDIQSKIKSIALRLRVLHTPHPSYRL
jgi:hypothetical protein